MIISMLALIFFLCLMFICSRFFWLFSIILNVFFFVSVFFFLNLLFFFFFKFNDSDKADSFDWYLPHLIARRLPELKRTGCLFAVNTAKLGNCVQEVHEFLRFTFECRFVLFFVLVRLADFPASLRPLFALPLFLS